MEYAEWRYHGVDGAHRDQACPGARAARGRLAAAGRRTLLHGWGDLLRLETAAVQPRDLASLRAGRQRLPCLRRAVLRDPAGIVGRMERQGCAGSAWRNPLRVLR